MNLILRHEHENGCAAMVPELPVQLVDGIGGEPLDELKVHQRRMVRAKDPVELQDVECTPDAGVPGASIALVHLCW